MIRHEYVVSPHTFQPSGRTVPNGYEVREPAVGDSATLARLMMDAYVGTIDYEGETEQQALEEVAGYFANEAYLGVSRIALADGAIQSAMLISRLAGIPIVGYAMTRAAVKGQGLASALLDLSVVAVWGDGYEELRAFITEGNTPSEVVFTRSGFAKIGTHADG